MDALIINLDLVNKKGNFTQGRVIGINSLVCLSIYNFVVAPNVAGLKAIIYAGDGTPISSCGPFSLTAGTYSATLSLKTPEALLYFSIFSIAYSESMTLVVSDGVQLYCNSKIKVKNG